MKGLLTRKIALVVAVVTASLGLSANKISADVGITKLADVLQINIKGKWSALRFVGLTSDNTLVNIDPSGFAKAVKVKGIDGNLQGIDFRPANGLLYGVTDTDNVYTINLISGQAQFVSKLSSSFNGGFQSGFDFNPVPDRLRIVGSNDQNFRTNVDTGAVSVDQPLAYASDDVNATVDPNITAAAYTNSVAGATSTQLFGIDYDLDVLVLQNPPNDGTLRTIGNLGVNFAPNSGFDIFTDAQGKDTAYALSGAVLYSIDLSTGVASEIADVPKGTFIGLAVTSK
ncbi:DUF4394 domain-containing protein [Nostoc flagelliforme FACHB-838]|uniref:DUF4394 domain-containing protein n=1 Tax=Nostoc flagelliforme FACHB-838 TaxID=2692904 RepID=A0ABR8DX04_9NOSO|nr:DUF4394 domain-containing protein [Nostoc flagelliforme]MBD2534002.1 DUF4394 domain-containing protein [Nostoc flagelliforme FACHB-838]